MKDLLRGISALSDVIGQLRADIAAAEARVGDLSKNETGYSDYKSPYNRTLAELQRLKASLASKMREQERRSAEYARLLRLPPCDKPLETFTPPSRAKGPPGTPGTYPPGWTQPPGRPDGTH